MFVVIVTFNPASDALNGNLDAVHATLRDLVRHQPGFVRARLHKGKSGDKPRVVNYVEWENREAFQAFRAAHGAAVTERVGAFSPEFALFETVLEINTTIVA